MRSFLPLLAITLVSVSAVAPAAETVEYTYDAKGRLITASHTGSLNSGVTRYTFDAADNRMSTTTTGTPYNAPTATAVALPLGGLKIISLPKPGP